MTERDKLLISWLKLGMKLTVDELLAAMQYAVSNRKNDSAQT